MLLESNEFRPPGTKVFFESLPLSGTGEVVWTRAASDDTALLGMQFVRLDRVDEKLLPGHDSAEIDADRAQWRIAMSGTPSNGPSFREATDRLLEQRLTLVEIAFVLGQPEDAIRAARTDPRSPAYRELPADWRELLAGLARSGGPALEALARELGGW